MTTEKFIEGYAAAHFLIIGASHIIQHRAWAELFMHLHRLGRAGVFAHGFLSIFFGSLIVAGHNVWTGPATALTVAGWFYIIKSFHSFLIPSIGTRTLSRVSVESSRVFIAPGAIMFALGLISAYCALDHR